MKIIIKYASFTTLLSLWTHSLNILKKLLFRLCWEEDTHASLGHKEAILTWKSFSYSNTTPFSTMGYEHYKWLECFPIDSSVQCVRDYISGRSKKISKRIQNIIISLESAVLWIDLHVLIRHRVGYFWWTPWRSVKVTLTKLSVLDLVHRVPDTYL